MAEWLYEAGIGETRAALVERGRILQMQIERDGEPGPRVGAIRRARLTRKADGSARGLVTLDGGITAQLQAVPPGLTEGAALTVEVIREALREGAETK
ncbi:MAG: ribonuclease, partial [Sphingomonas sp.]|nr:ribonuclease [Sphingomonas sp.]